MGIKLDRRGFWLTAGATVMAASFAELPAVLAQQKTGDAHRMKPELADVPARSTCQHRFIWI
jgi:hypothetical protein